MPKKLKTIPIKFVKVDRASELIFPSSLLSLSSLATQQFELNFSVSQYFCYMISDLKVLLLIKFVILEDSFERFVGCAIEKAFKAEASEKCSEAF